MSLRGIIRLCSRNKINMPRYSHIFSGVTSLCLIALTMTAHAQTIADNSNVTTSEVSAAIKNTAARFKFPEKTIFRKIRQTHTEDGNFVCGEIDTRAAGGKDTGFSLFGIQDGHTTPSIFETKAIPKKIKFNDVNNWINRSVALEDLEDMGCVPSGSYKKYEKQLNTVLQTRD
ncbi:MAG: hypothetical protein LKH33_00445 [Acetobacter sp.]|nr:hypothetical protein [Acetobacter sp.]